MKSTECDKCAWANISDKPRVIRNGDVTFYQPAGSIDCTCKNIERIVITEDGMICSSYKERG